MSSPRSLLSIVSPERPQALAVASRLGPLSAKGFDITYDNGFYNIGIPPHLAAAIKRGELGPLDYARGGRVRRSCCA